MNRNLRTIVGLGLVGAAAGVAQAQPFLINLTGATLLENPLTGNALTNDFFGADLDGNSIRQNGVVDNLNPASTPNAIGGSDWWVIQYRLVGSVNGFQELVTFADVQVTDGHAGVVPGEGFTSKAYFNRTLFINNTARVNSGAGAGLYNEGNPGGSPARCDANLVAQFNTPPAPSAGFWRADIAPVDVPSLWAVQSLSPGIPQFNRTPGEPGYGRNTGVTLNKDGTVNGFSHLLVNLGPRNLAEATPNANTIFDTDIAYAPVAVLTSLGTGLREMRQTDLRHLYVTGRTQGGENLHAVTREVGSGTHNSIMNSLCLDPSWGIGENVGGLTVQFPINNTLLGPDFQPGNTLGSGEMEAVMFNSRLGIGYSGAERGGGSTGWLTTGRLELIGVINDHIGGTTPVRPTLTAVLHNGDADSAWRIGGTATLNTLGDPKASSATYGGDANGNPQMLNPHAAAFINNITESIEEFDVFVTPFTPAEDLANRGLFLPGSTDLVPQTDDPCNYIAQPADPQVTTNLQDYYINVSSNRLKGAAYATFGTVTLNGKVPTRKQSVTYTDGVVNGTNYVQLDGDPLHYGNNLNDRNRIAGDFNGDAERNWDDIADMMVAWKHLNGGPAWSAPAGNATLNNDAGGNVCIEVIGDFNGDGNFDEMDVRYFADGLAIDPASGAARLLNRAEGFERVDAAFGGNFFTTTLANGSYDAGDSRADVAGSIGTTPNFQPIGNDGIVDNADIDYIYANFVADWADTLAAVGNDLSCDVNGDLIVDQADVCELVTGILETSFGDADLDGDVDAVDMATVQASINTPPANAGWADGDFNGDGVVNNSDLAIANGTLNPCVPGCPADLSGSSDPNDPGYGVPDGLTDASDFFYYLDQFVSNNLAVADLSGSSDPNDPAYGVPDGLIDASDFFYYLDLFVTPCP